MTGGTSDRPVLVAMLTYRRPDDLAAAVPAVLEQLRSVRPAGTLLVVDNDPAAGAAATVRSWAEPDVRYVHEPSPGIAAARNRALDECPRDALLVFIDDDERPQPGWLAALLATHQQYGSVAVVGAVVSEFAVEPGAWMAAGRFFERRRMPTGRPIDVAATNNLLLDTAVVRRAGLRFDDRFGQSGGSDTLFSRQLSRIGSMVWCDEAVVVDRVPEARLTRSWVLGRAARSGNSWVRTSLALEAGVLPRTAVRARATAAGTVRIAGGSTVALTGMLTGSLERRARGRRTLARGVGMVSGALGHVRAEYRRTAGPAADSPVPEKKSGEPDRVPRLGIVVVNYGSTQLLELAVGRLDEDVPADVVVVDNWHSESERAAVTELCHRRRWTLVARPGNDGFGVAANAGAAVLIDHGCDVLLVLNPDATIGVEACRELAASARKHPDALVSPRITRPDGSLWFRGVLLDPDTGRPVNFSGPFVSAANGVLTGACLACSVPLWRRLGGFSGAYFLYWEDVDLSYRCVRSGGELIVAENIVAEHSVGGTQQRANRGARTKSNAYYFYNCRNRLVFAAKNLPTGRLLRWIASTPKESTAILLRGGRRQLVTTPVVMLSAVAGSAVGLAVCAGELVARLAGSRIHGWGSSLRRQSQRARRLAGRFVTDPAQARYLLAARFRMAVLRTVNRHSTRRVVGAAPVVVNLTTFGARSATAFYAIESISLGKVRPARLILWVDERTILDDLPVSLRRLQRRGLEVLPTEDFGPHKKQYPYARLQAQHEWPLVAADDDIMYPRRWLEGLMAAYREQPDAVACFRAHVVHLDESGLRPYAEWTPRIGREALLSVFPTGVSGILYPPALLHHLRAAGERFLALSPRADDIWVHSVAVAHGIKSHQVTERQQYYPPIPGTQIGTLYRFNVREGGNDRQIRAVYTVEQVNRLRAEQSSR